MIGPVVELKYDPNAKLTPHGAAWVMVCGHEYSADCVTFDEVNYALSRLEEEIARVRKTAKAKFEQAARDRVSR